MNQSVMKSPLRVMPLTSLLWVLLCLMFWLGTTYAAQGVPAGRIISVTGSLSAIEAGVAIEEMKLGSSFYQGQLLKTETSSNAQLRFRDGTLVALKPESELKIDKFSFDEAKPEQDQNDKTLLRGGIRVATGIIARRSPAAYRTRTSMATIGVRGTVYEVVLGDSLFVGVWQGRVNVSNTGGSLDLGENADFNFAEVNSPDEPPQGLLKPPIVFLDGSADAGSVPGEEQQEEGSTDGEESAPGEETEQSGSPAQAEQESSDTGPESEAELDGFPPAEDEPLTAGSEPGATEESPVTELIDPVASSDPADTNTGITGTSGTSGTSGAAATTTDLRLSATELASLDRTGIIVFGGSGARSFMGGKSSDGAGGNPIITDNNLHPGEAGYDTTDPVYVIRRGGADLDSINTNGTYDVSWGAWNGTTNGVEIQTDPGDPTVIKYENRPTFWITMIATPQSVLDSLTGSKSYGGTVLFAQGGGSGGGVTTGNFALSLSVNFDTAAASGTMAINNAENWSISYSGQLVGPVIDIKPENISGTVYVSPSNYSVQGDIGMMLTGGSADAVGGVFDLEKVGDPSIHVEGVFLSE